MSLFSLKNFINLILENKFSDAIKRNQKMAEYLIYFKQANINPGYIPWLIKQNLEYKLDSLTDKQIIHDLIRDLKDYDMLKKQNRISKENRDINSLSYSSLFALIHSLKKNPTPTQQRKLSKSGSEIIFDSDEWFLVEPKTMEASCFYGKGTKWCISSTEAENYFGWYDQGHRFLFIINKPTNNKMVIKTNPKDKTIEVFNAKNNRTHLPINKLPENILNTIYQWLSSKNINNLDYDPLYY